MVFRRRDKLPLGRRMRESILPRTGWRRAVTYMGHRLKRLPDSADNIARGISYGIFTSFSPFFGLHIILAILMAKYMRGNVFAAALGTFFGNPLTFPFIIPLSYRLGQWMLGTDGTYHGFEFVRKAFSDGFIGLWQTIKSLAGYGESHMDRLVALWNDVFFPYMIGGLIPGIIFGIAGFYLSRPLIHAYQNLRRKRLQKKRDKMLDPDDLQG